MTYSNPAFIRTLQGETLKGPPVWFMRQAGRYLPEYRELRTQASDFIKFCLNPEMAAEATLQPLRRFAFDAAIIFADILLIPMALGQQVRFEAGEGPVLGPLPELDVLRLSASEVEGPLAAVGESLQRVRAALPPETALIGFCGAPWTLLTYMLDGAAGSDRAAVRRFAYEQPEKVAALLEILIEASARYLAFQAKSGAQALQVFESWAQDLPDELFTRLVAEPHQKLAARVRALGVEVPIIGFPRGAPQHLAGYVETSGVTAVGLDVSAPLSLGQALQKKLPIQGALDPMLLRAGGPALDRRVEAMLEAWGRGPWVFNLGHGILPDTPITHVEQVLKRIKAFA